MRLPIGWGRLAGGLILIIAAFGSSLTSPAAIAQDGGSSIEIHDRVCPPGYAGDSFYDDCHGTPAGAGLAFTFANGATHEGATNSEGNVGIANLPEGTYTITGVPPAELEHRVVSCAVGTAEASNQSPIDISYVDSGIQLYLPADTNVICDWYNVPAGQPETPTEDLPTETATATETVVTASGSIEVHNRTCAPESAGQNAFDACHDNVGETGLPFTFAGPVTNEGTTNAAGDVGFGNLQEGTYAITGGASADRFVYCSVGTAETSNQAPVEVEYISGGVQIQLPAETNVICDWYDMPTGGQDEAPETDVAPSTATEQRAGDNVAEATPVTGEGQTEATETATEVATATERRVNRAGLFGGSCDSLTDSTLLTELQSLGAPSQDAEQPESGPDETSVTTVPVPLDELANGENMVVVFYDDPSGEYAVPVACAQLTGEPDESSNVVVELQPMDGSGSTGTATLTPAETDSTQTNVAISLSEETDGNDVQATPAA